MANLDKFLNKAGVSTLWGQIAAEVAKVDAKAGKNAEDIKNLPHCDMGSTALVISTGEVYMVDSKGEWHKL